MQTEAEPSKTSKSKGKIRHLPRWNVILENDTDNFATYVIERIVELTPLNQDEASQKTLEAHKTGRSILLSTNLERAELYKDQFLSCRPPISITIEPQ